MSKLAIFLCIVFFASATNASIWSAGLESVQQKVVGSIDSTINRIRNIFATFRTKAEGIYAKLLEEASNARKKVQEKVNEILKRIRDEIVKMIGKADGVDVTECTEFFSRVEFTGRAVLSNMTLCINEKLKTGTEYIQSMVEISKNVLANLTEIREKASHCGDNVDGVKSAAAAIACVNGAAAKSTWVSAKVVPEMSLKFAKLNILLGTLQPSLAYCTTNNGLTTFYEQSSNIVDITNKCIQQKINEVRGTRNL